MDLLNASSAIGLEVDVIPERFRFDPRVLPRMARRIRERRPDIVETHDFKSHFLFWTLRKMGAIGPVPWVAFHHGYTRMSLQVRGYQQLDRFTLRAANQVITLCIPFASDLEVRGVRRERVAVITNVVEKRRRPVEAELSRLRQSLGILTGERIVLCVGRLSKEKGHAELIMAFRAIRAQPKHSDCRLLLVGDGGERAALVRQAADLGNRVIFVGHQPDPWPYFCIADIFALPSHSEGSPLVLFEAMAAGLPIVASAVGGIPEVVTDDTSATLLSPGDVGQLAAGISKLLSDPRRAAEMGAAAAGLLAKYTPEAYFNRLMSIYDNLLAR
jgi:glycosyltransferase involved in cell wall biosynthesis